MCYTGSVAVVAQLVEQLIRNEQVAGSKPVNGSTTRVKNLSSSQKAPPRGCFWLAAGLGEADKLIIFGADAVGGGNVDDVGAEFFFDASDELVATWVGALVDEVNAGLVKGDGVGGGEEADVGHTGSGGVGVAVAINGDIDHGGDVGGAALEIAVDAGGGIAHSGDEGELGGGHIVAVGLAGAVDVFLAVGGGAADGKLF